MCMAISVKELKEIGIEKKPTISLRGEIYKLLNTDTAFTVVEVLAKIKQNKKITIELTRKKINQALYNLYRDKKIMRLYDKEGNALFYKVEE